MVDAEKLHRCGVARAASRNGGINGLGWEPLHRATFTTVWALTAVSGERGA